MLDDLDKVSTAAVRLTLNRVLLRDERCCDRAERHRRRGLQSWPPHEHDRAGQCFGVGVGARKERCGYMYIRFSLGDAGHHGHER